MSRYVQVLYTGDRNKTTQLIVNIQVANKDVENSRIIVDVPHHLIPPEIASKSPIQSPNVRRKGLLKKTPCLLQHSLSHGERGEKGSDFTSADSGLSLSDETDYSHQQDVTNFCLVREPKSNSTNSALSPSPLASKNGQSKHSRQNSLHKTEILHRVDRPSFEGKNIPHVITINQAHLSETVSKTNGHASNEHTHKVISPILPKYKDKFENNTNDSVTINTDTIRYQKQTNMSFTFNNKKDGGKDEELEVKTPSNSISVARVPPFKKSDDSAKQSSPPCDDKEQQNDNNCGEIQLTRKPSVIWAIVKKMEVSLVIQRDYGDPEVIKIEDFNVRRVNTYKDVEELVVDTYMKHLQLLDKQHLDLDTYDIKYLQMADHKVPIGSSFDLSLVKIEDSFLPCRLCMKDKESWSLASLSYDSLIPKSYLEKYVSLILSHHHAIFFGPSGTGKSYLAERIANLINYRMNEGTIPPIILKNATPERWRTLLTNLSAEKRDKPFVIILDGFSQRFIESDIDIHDIIKVCEEKDPKPYIICTMTITPNTEIPAKWQLSFRWIWLSNHEEPIDGILQRYLRRKFIQYGNQHLQRESFRIADWLTAVWRHINTFLSKFTSTDCSIGPTMFYDCPSDILDAEEWFVDLWNYSITPYILHSVKQGLKQHGVRCEWEDPLTYILKSYPWVSEKVKKKMKLKRICMEDVDYSLHCHTEEEKQRLLDFLRQLEVMMFENVEPGNHPCSKGYRKESSL